MNPIRILAVDDDLDSAICLHRYCWDSQIWNLLRCVPPRRRAALRLPAYSPILS